MFRMEFQSVADHEAGPSSSDTARSDYMNGSVYEQVRDESCDVQSTPVVFKGRVGRFGKVHRVGFYLDRVAPWKSSRILSPNASLPGARNWTSETDVSCLQGVATQDAMSTHQAIFLDAEVLRSLGRPVDDDASSFSSSSPASMRSDSFRSDPSSASEGSVAEMNALQRKSKPWEEPLLALHQQAEVDRRVEREAQQEAKRLAAQEAPEALRTQRELRDLANCVDSSPTGGSFRKNRLQRVLSKTGVTAVCRFLKNPFGLCKSPNGYAAAQRQGVDAHVVAPGRAFSESHTRSHPSSALAQMRSVPRRQARFEMQFATVISTQRDVPAWTMEEYMTRNAKLHKWHGRKHDAEFGGIEGNNLMNQYFDNGDDVPAAYDSDSD